MTYDIDFLLRKQPNTPDQLEKILTEIIKIDTGHDFISFEIKKIKPIAVAKKYAGISASMSARIKNTVTPFSIDFGVGDVIVPNQEKRQIPTQLPDFPSPAILTYSIETTVAEKLDAILNLLEYSSRMKDYYDLYYLANKFTFDPAVLSEAMAKTFENRNHSFTMSDFNRILSFHENPAMVAKWNAFASKANVGSIAFSAVLETLETFLMQPLERALNGQNLDFTYGKWLRQKDRSTTETYSLIENATMNICFMVAFYLQGNFTANYQPLSKIR